MSWRFAAVGAAAAAVSACVAIGGVDKYSAVDCVDCAAPDAAGGDGSDGGTCAHLFCADWDEGDVRTGWGSFEQSNGTRLEVDNQFFRSPPRSLLVGVGPGNVSNPLVARLTQQFAVPPTTTKLELDLRVAEFSPTDAGAGAIEVLSVLGTAKDTGASTGVSLVWLAAGPALVVTASAGTTETVPLADGSIPAGGWVHLSTTFTFDSAGRGAAKVLADGKVAVDRSGLMLVNAGAGSTTLAVGLKATGASPPLQINVDKLTFDIQ